ncbi:transmembrane protein, putative (macronuclear) [Tetrahymena thermophila SB210]|uniref:Transmembrane protein, putative n=1 Tax=Tetrahymena thermophila (strain SB210) TaxID=312017 RepID=I7M1W5_TETTS|nr:transmembrane protein, putative [Tetrahymena thermophila SB210]EAR97913.2 transmembrane protein, putative [Tetrahymena thermophila SB210]|eukprot:XP_001018158.2 transmembrane protein, putative [Tetrahymena thermophila SB210]
MLGDQIIPVYWENFQEEEEEEEKNNYQDIYNSEYINRLIFQQEKVEYYEVLNIVGSDDFYQLIMSLLVGLIWFFSGLGLYSIPYIFQNPKFMCYEGFSSHDPIQASQTPLFFNASTSNQIFDNLPFKNKEEIQHQHNLIQSQQQNQQFHQYQQNANQIKIEELEGYECWENELACRKQIVIMNDRLNQMNSSLITQFSMFCSHFHNKILILSFFFAGASLGVMFSQVFISNRLGQALQIKIYLLLQSINIFCMCFFAIDFIFICSHIFFAGFFGFALWSISQTYLRDICSKEFFIDYRCAIFFLNTISQMSVTLLFTFISEWRKSLIYAVSVPLGILFIACLYFMIENPRFLIGRSNSNRVYKAFYDIFLFNDARKFFSPRQFDIVYVKMLVTLKLYPPQNQNGNQLEGQQNRRQNPLSSPSSGSNLSPSQLNRNSNNHNINLLSEMNNNINNNNNQPNRINTNDLMNNRNNTVDNLRANTQEQIRFNTIDINRVNTQDYQRANTVGSPFYAQQSNKNNLQCQQQQALDNFSQPFLQQQQQIQQIQQPNLQNYYQSQINIENNKMEDIFSRKSIQNNSNNLMLQNKLDLQSYNRNNLANLAEDKSIDKISLISLHNPTPEIMSNIFLKIPSNNQINNQNSTKLNNQKMNEDIQSLNSNNPQNSNTQINFQSSNNQINLQNSFVQQKNQFNLQTATNQFAQSQQENQQAQMNINNLQTEYFTRSQMNLNQNDNIYMNNNNNTNNILITNMNNNPIQLTTNNYTYQAFTHINMGEEQKSQSEAISNNTIAYRQNQNIENNVCEESENQQPYNEKQQFQEYLKRLIVYIFASSVFFGMYFLFMMEIDKIGINLSYNIFILGFSEFIGILFADKFIEFPDPRNTVKHCLFVSGILSTSFIMMKQSKYCEASHIAVCPEKIVQLLFIGLIRFSTIFGLSFLIRNFKLIENTSQMKEQTWKWVNSIGIFGVFIPLIILLITKSIYSTIFIYGIVSMLVSLFFRT